MWNQIYISRGKASKTASVIVGTHKKKLCILVFVFVEKQKINFRGILKVNMMNIVYFYVTFSCFAEKVSPWPRRLFSKCFYPTLTPFPRISTPGKTWLRAWKFQWLNWCALVDNYVSKINCNITKKPCKFVIKKLKHT